MAIWAVKKLMFTSLRASCKNSCGVPLRHSLRESSLERESEARTRQTLFRHRGTLGLGTEGVRSCDPQKKFTTARERREKHQPACFNHASGIQDRDHVCIHNRLETMCHHKHGTPVELGPEGFLNQGVRLTVHARRCLIHQHDPATSRYASCNAEPRSKCNNVNKMII